ncbi:MULTISPECIES: phosphonate C-P lyase system protein PhnH [unclassified Cupriavidus]|uniref:phosphonate C-P lyase system protein PhnH n=1 Tax=unclassified Cupriavidus TaxID=2640874 RepID=UPI001AE7D0A2|nr:MULTISPECIES: phosphonate C-P lyase system protein PhnH [unclassified Cupriavidus]MBP0632246.1 phosphonate C-P lyase system protein PhnH [Cupriavidus sp. AcVe19-1a]MBP0636861.1 phosphonate C-P lyase system protein PhnH [Cupriavidus sp. AcVe19-6a]
MISTRTSATPMPSAATSLVPGFDNPVDDAQQVFRATLHAFAHPGQVQSLPATTGLPDGLSPALAALLLTLADPDTPVWLPAGVPAAARAFLRFHCGCPLTDDLRAATFVCVPAGHAMPALADCAQGEPAFPDRSATLLVEVASLGDGDIFTLRGPGIEHTQTLRVAGLEADFRGAWRANNDRFPLGVDLLLASGDRFCALTRTTQMEA